MNKPCECLNICGDDPDISKQKCKPCNGFIKFHLDYCRVNKLATESELIPLYQDVANRKLKEAEKAWHDLCSLLPVCDQCTAAFEVFENIRNAARV